MDLFKTSAMELHGPTEPYKSLAANGASGHHTFTALAVLEDKGLAAGAANVNLKGHVDLFNTSALELHGPTDPYKSLDASGEVAALAVLEDTGGANREEFNSNTTAKIINMTNTQTRST